MYFYLPTVWLILDPIFEQILDPFSDSWLASCSLNTRRALFSTRFLHCSLCCGVALVWCHIGLVLHLAFWCCTSWCTLCFCLALVCTSDPWHQDCNLFPACTRRQLGTMEQYMMMMPAGEHGALVETRTGWIFAKSSCLSLQIQCILIYTQLLNKKMRKADEKAGELFWHVNAKCVLEKQ